MHKKINQKKVGGRVITEEIHKMNKQLQLNSRLNKRKKKPND